MSPPSRASSTTGPTPWRGLRTARSYTFGIVVPQLDNPVFSSAIMGAELAAAMERVEAMAR